MGCCISIPNASFESYKAATKLAYIQVQDRFQLQMSNLEDRIEKDNPVRLIDALADQLDLRNNGRPNDQSILLRLKQSDGLPGPRPWIY